MKAIKFFSKTIVTIVAGVMILALLLVLLSLFLTPATIRLENLEIGGVSLEEQGLANTSFYNIGKIAIGLLDTPDHESVEEEVYQETVGKLPEISKSSSSQSDDESKSESLESLVKEPLYFEEEVEIQMDSSELSAMLNMVIGSKSISDLGDLNSYFAGNLQDVYFCVPSDNGASLDVKISMSDAEEYFEVSESLMLSMLQEYNCEFVSIIPTADENYIYLATVAKLFLPEDIVAKINGMNVITITDCIYISLESKYVLEDGALVPVEVDESSIIVNKLSRENTITTSSSLMSIAAGEKVDGEKLLIEYNNTATSLIGKIFNNLAEVQKVENNQIYFKTRTE